MAKTFYTFNMFFPLVRKHKDRQNIVRSAIDHCV